MLAHALAGQLLDRRLLLLLAHAVAQRQHEILAMLPFPQFRLGGLARGDVQEQRHHLVVALAPRPRFVPGRPRRRHGELELRRFAGLDHLRERIHDLARHAGNHLAQRVAERVAFLHATLPLERGVDLDEAEIDDAALRVAQRLAQEEGLLHALEHGAPAFAAAAQRGGRQVPLDRQRGAARHHRDRVDVMRRRRARHGVVVGEHAQQMPVRRLDRGRPAGAQAMRQGQLAPRRPGRVAGDVLHVHGAAGMRRHAPRGHLRPDRRPVDRGIEHRRQAGRGAVHQQAAGLVDQRDGGTQLDARLRLDGVQHMAQHLGQGHARGNALQHHALVFQTRERVGPGMGYSVSLGQHGFSRQAFPTVVRARRASRNPR